MTRDLSNNVVHAFGQSRADATGTRVAIANAIAKPGIWCGCANPTETPRSKVNCGMQQHHIDNRFPHSNYANNHGVRCFATILRRLLCQIMASIEFVTPIFFIVSVSANLCVIKFEIFCHGSIWSLYSLYFVLFSHWQVATGFSTLKQIIPCDFAGTNAWSVCFSTCESMHPRVFFKTSI